MGSLSKPFHSVSFGDEAITCVSFSPFEWSKNFLAIGTENKVAIANVQFEKVRVVTVGDEGKSSSDIYLPFRMKLSSTSSENSIICALLWHSPGAHYPLLTLYQKSVSLPLLVWMARFESTTAIWQTLKPFW